jgi:hypothetical protein
MMKNVSLLVKKMIGRLLVVVLLAMTFLSPTPATAAIRLNVAEPLADFTLEGGQSFIPSPTVLSLNDGSLTDVVNLYAPDPAAAPGRAIDIFAAFQIRTASLFYATSGVHLVINDGATKAVVAACIVVAGIKGIGLARGTDFSNPDNYPVFVPVDWSAPTTVRIRRTADGDGEIVEINGVAPSPRALLASPLLAVRNRVVSTVELGCTVPEALVNVEFTQFFTETPSTPQVIVPVNGVTPTLVPVTINASAGDQNDPHISGDWLSYASDTSIRYYNFATNIDAQIPLGSSSRDLLSDVSGSRIVFSRIIMGVTTAVMVFDGATPAVLPIEIDAALAATRLGSAIGSNTVAYIDFGLHGNGELVIHDLATATSLRITNDTNPDQSPSVSPDGNIVTWEHCTSSFSNCDIWQAVKSGAVWDVSVVSNTANPEANPDTNGTLVVYDSVRASNGDLFWRQVNGGTEVQLQMPGFDANPSIAGNLIAFESRPTQASTTDIFVYDITTNLLYRITETPLVSEQLNDITVLPDCRIRVVWANDEDGASERNIKAATFSLNACNDNTAPVLDSISDVVVNLPPNSTATSMSVTFPTPTATDDSGTATVTTSPVSGAVFLVGTTTVDVTATDDAGNTATGSFTVTVLHNFFGFLQPVENLPVLNVINAGRAVPVKFSLSGNKGLNILAAGYPISGPIACDANELGSVIEGTIAAGGSSLSYDAAADRYSYVWNTDTAWRGTCRILALRLKDGSDHFAKFRLR